MDITNQLGLAALRSNWLGRLTFPDFPPLLGLLGHTKSSSDISSTAEGSARLQRQEIFCHDVSMHPCSGDQQLVPAVGLGGGWRIHSAHHGTGEGKSNDLAAMERRSRSLESRQAFKHM